jgi:hypothetical protein
MIRTIAFGDLDEGAWGSAWIPAGGRGGVAGVGALGTGSARVIKGPAVEGAADTATEWRLAGEQFELSLTPDGEPASITLTTPGFEGFDQLCRVRGRVAIDGVEHTVDCLGRRGCRSGDGELRAIQSIRDVSAWFGNDEGLAVVSLRPRRKKGHDKDEVSGAVFEGGASLVVAEPRLSTTYGADGRPARAGLELWFADEEEDQDDIEPQYARRAAGEAMGTGFGFEDARFDVRAELFRWHMRGLDGLGVYQLVTVR